jgi:hypothetical protein
MATCRLVENLRFGVASQILRLSFFTSFVVLTALTQARATTIVVPSGGDLQAALNVAQFGDTIILQAGATFTAPSFAQGFVLFAKSGGTGTDADYITVRSSRSDQLPSGRVSPADKVNMAKIVALGFGGAFGTQNNSRYWKVVGLEITNSSSGTANEHVGTMLELGNYQTGLQNIWFDRCYVHPQEEGTTDYTRTATRGFGVNGITNFILTNSYVSGFFGELQHVPPTEWNYIDGEAIASNLGNGYLIENNFLQAHFNPIFLGGGGTGTTNFGTVQASPAPTLTSATLSAVANLNVGDYVSFPQGGNPNANGRVLSINGNTIKFTSLHRLGATPVAPIPGSTALWNGEMIRNAVIRRNTFDIDTANAQYEFDKFNRRMPKGYIEIKHCDTCLLEGNIFQGWPATVAVNSVNQSGDAPWTVVRNFIFRNNWIKNFGSSLSMAFGNPTGAADGHMSVEGSNILIENNLFTQTNHLPDDYGMTKIGIWGYGQGVTIRHNTWINTNPGGAMLSSNGPITNFVFKDNIVFNNLYGINCGMGDFSTCYPRWVEGKNVIINDSNEEDSAIQAHYPASYIVRNPRGVGFVNYEAGDYRLSQSSVFKGKGTAGTDPGVDVGILKSALGNASSSLTSTR